MKTKKKNVTICLGKKAILNVKILAWVNSRSVSNFIEELINKEFAKEYENSKGYFLQKIENEPEPFTESDFNEMLEYAKERFKIK